MSVMKRALAVSCSCVLALSLAACGGSKKAVKSPDDFEGAKISVQTATTASDSLDEMKAAGKKIEVFPYEKVTQCFDDLKLNRVDAVYVDSVVAAYYTNGSNSFDQVWLSDEKEPMGICMNKKSANLAAAVEAAIDTLYYNGTIGVIATKHFGKDFTAGLRTVTEKPVIPALTDADFIAAGTFTVGAEIGYPPMEYTDSDGKTFIGFDIDVATALADIFGVQVKFVNTSWDGIFAGLEKGQYDAIISAVSITPDRQERYILTEPYVANALCIVTNK